MRLDDFDRLTPTELAAALRTRRRLQNDDWRKVQYLMWAAMRPHYKRLSPTDVLKLPDDKPKVKRRQLTPAEQAQREAKIREMDRRALAEFQATTRS